MPLIVQGSEKPRVILGAMTFGPEGKSGVRISDTETFNKALDALQTRGYNEIDTARVYCEGEQEAFTRDAKWKERGLTLATKVKYPANGGENTYEGTIESVEKSLKELGTDCVDILYLHRPDRATPFVQTLSALDKLHKEGKFVKLGLSNFAAFEVAEVVMTCKHNGWVRPTVYQGMYNAITRNIEPELFVACRRYGLDIVVYNPIAGGLFSGKIKSKDVIPESGRFGKADDTLGSRYRERYFTDGTFNALKIVEQAAEKSNLTMIELALRWMVHHSGLKVTDGNDGIIIGVSSVDQINSNLDNIEKGPLPEEAVKALDAAWEAARQESSPYWHGELKYGYDTYQTLFAPGAK